MSVVCVAKYTSVEEALVARSKLEFYEVPAWFVEEHAARCKWVYLQGASYCHIEVPASFAEDARFLLADTNEELEAEDYGEAYVSKRFWLMALCVALSIQYFGIIFIADHLWHWWKKVRR
ncbi:hypothetical protein MTBPR1_90158 [Candidatus Terasakiella magnetica]|uniref:DUF2007 domain-containing protein n=1 Tax=Candidatus Terasakiella magnetica TaxID=1867952 RepID=A0A1C3RLZ7_9PROT|nr:hypothetical protein [Candidatus Terasakiella magnetica]SCA58311.1 hypothetical protein MTBPR1_90158 [Candidatus Terasakiella magnetica]